jgi:hypothetical protein
LFVAQEEKLKNPTWWIIYVLDCSKTTSRRGGMKSEGGVLYVPCVSTNSTCGERDAKESEEGEGEEVGSA